MRDKKRNCFLHVYYTSRVVGISVMQMNEDGINAGKKTKHILHWMNLCSSHQDIASKHYVQHKYTVYWDMNQQENEVQRNNRQYHLSIFRIMYISICHVHFLPFQRWMKAKCCRDWKQNGWIGNKQQEWNEVNGWGKVTMKYIIIHLHRNGFNSALYVHSTCCLRC